MRPGVGNVFAVDECRRLRDGVRVALLRTLLLRRQGHVDVVLGHAFGILEKTT